MSIIKPLFPLNKDNIYWKTNDFTIFKHYCNNFQTLNKLFNSPFRKEDNPSCIITVYDGKLWFRDFGLGKSFTAIDFVQYLYNLSYYDTLEKINRDLYLGLQSSNINIKSKPIKFEFTHKLSDNLNTIIKIKSIPFTEEGLNYWESYGWTLDMLIAANIRQIDFFWIVKQNQYTNDKFIIDVRHKLAFSYDYYWHNSIFRRKIYLPLEKNRFYSNVDNTIIQGWDLLPKYNNNELFITSSFKDVGVFWRLNNYYSNSIAPNNEIMFIPEDIFWTKIKPRFKRIIAWLNNDSTGIINSLKWAEKYQIEAYFNPIRCPHKDPSDFVKYEGLREFNYLKNELIKI
jgi:hypothetical protein